MKSLLRRKHWQIFIFIMLGLVLINYKSESNPLLESIMYWIGLLTYLLYPFLIIVFFKRKLPAELIISFKIAMMIFAIGLVIHISQSLFLHNILLTADVIIVTLTNNHSFPSNKLILAPLLMPLYAFVHLSAFLAKAIKSIESGKVAKLKEYIKELLLIMFLPLGIWLLQPRISRILKN
jgi:hypothetical protein